MVLLLTTYLSMSIVCIVAYGLDGVLRKSAGAATCRSSAPRTAVATPRRVAATATASVSVALQDCADSGCRE